MVTFKPALAVLSIAVLTVGASAEDNNPAMAKSLNMAYNKLTRAIVTHDVKTMESLMAPDFVWVDSSFKESNRAEFLAGWKDSIKMVKVHSMEVRKDAMDFSDHLARVRAHTTVHLSMKQGKKWMHMKATDDAVDSWRWTAKNGWQCYRVEVTAETVEPM